MSEGELITLPEVAQVATPAQPTTPMEMLSLAVSQGADLDKISKLMDLQERWEASEARKTFNAAFAAFKSEAVLIIKNIKVTDGPLKGKSYADLFAVVNAITPALSKHGLSASWKLTKDEKDWLEVTCYLRHVDGHTETAFMGGPPDVGGAKSAIQSRASAKSYLERYTLMAITGMAASGDDKDGQNAGQAFGMDEETFQGHLAAIKASATIADLQKTFTTAFNASKADKPTQKAFIDAKDQRKAELAGGAK